MVIWLLMSLTWGCSFCRHTRWRSLRLWLGLVIVPFFKSSLTYFRLPIWACCCTLPRNLTRHWLLCWWWPINTLTLRSCVFLLFINSALLCRSWPCLILNLCPLYHPSLAVYFLLLLVAWRIVLTAFRSLTCSYCTSITLGLTACSWVASLLWYMLWVSVILGEILIESFCFCLDRLLSLLIVTLIRREPTRPLVANSLPNSLLHANLLTTESIVKLL